MHKNLYVHLFVSRNKDNEEIGDFKPRKKSFLAYEGDEKVSKKFEDFVGAGTYGEYCRHYVSANSRSEEKVREGLIIHLIKNKPTITRLESMSASIAAKPECAAEHKWLFDFDSRSRELLDDFLSDLSQFFTEEEKSMIEICDTPNGYSVIVPHGFDVRTLQKQWSSVVENKRDAMRFVEADTKLV